MRLQEIPRKALAKLVNLTFSFFNRDPISLVKIVRRDDLHEIGTKYGGWVIPSDLIESDSICYCVGCGEDISFDLGLIDKFGCHVFAFDPTPRAIKYVKDVAGEYSKYHFFEIGLWDKEGNVRLYAPRNPLHVSHSALNLQKTEDYIEVPVRRLQQIMDELGHERIDLLKIDIEGAEYKVVESVLEDNLDIRVICVEYDECHNPLDDNYKTRVRQSINRLIESGYALVHSQGIGNYTFVKKL